MIDIKFLRENPDTVKENIRKKFQDENKESGYFLSPNDQFLEEEESSPLEHRRLQRGTKT